MVGIDLNAVDDGEEDVEGSGPPAVCEELWRACAGPLVALPRKGSVVVYLPQGHLEQAGDGGGDAALANAIPPHVFCRVLDVKLHADVDTDDVFALLFLVPENEDDRKRPREGEEEGEVEDFGNEARSLPMAHMFCKTLTASDTSTHGGFSVPRRAAEDCFPPLDYKQQRPSQELMAMDLHGTQWKFRHIYRGQPRRHLLTTGWSAFINKKKLSLGDAVLFLRGAGGELRLGVRRAGQLKASSFSTHGYERHEGMFAAISRSITEKAPFQVYYNPRESSTNFILPHGRFMKSCSYSFSIGNRVRMRFENEDSSERCSGLIIGFANDDPSKWPGSKWRCLIVKWDDSFNVRWTTRVSPWDVEPSGSFSGSICLPAINCKRTRHCPKNNTEFSFRSAGGCPDFRESGVFHEVLQGQEVVDYRNSYKCSKPIINSQSSEIGHMQFDQQCNPKASGCLSALAVNRSRFAIEESEFSKTIGFGESLRFNEVLQGQEIFPSLPLSAGRFPIHPQVDTKYATHANTEATHLPCTNKFCGPLVGANAFPRPYMPTNLSSPSSVFMFPQVCHPPCSRTVYGLKDYGQGAVHTNEMVCNSKLFTEIQVQKHHHHSFHQEVGCTSPFSDHSSGGVSKEVCAITADMKEATDLASTSIKDCRLFGFSLSGTYLDINPSDFPESASPLSSSETKTSNSSNPQITSADLKHKGTSLVDKVFCAAACKSTCFSSL